MQVYITKKIKARMRHDDGTVKVASPLFQGDMTLTKPLMAL